MSTPDPRAISAFLDESHVAYAARLNEELCPGMAALAEPADDPTARLEARDLLKALGANQWLDPIGRRELRAICLTREALGATSPLADAVFALQGLAAVPMLLAPEARHRERWVPELLAGRAMGGFAITELEAGSDVGSLTTNARTDGNGWILNGRKAFISNAGIADVYVVFANADPSAGKRGIGAFVVPAETPGVEFTGAQILSSPHPLGELAFTDCRLPASARLAPAGEGLKLALATLDLLRPSVGAAACGMGARALQEALAHVSTRRQFGEPLATFQLVQEKLARMVTDLTAARLLVYRAAWAKDRGAERISLEAAMAKSYATEAAQRIVDDAVQLLGGRGVLAAPPVDRLYRSVRALRIYEGTTEIQHLVIAGQLLRGAR